MGGCPARDASSLQFGAGDQRAGFRPAPASVGLRHLGVRFLHDRAKPRRRRSQSSGVLPLKKQQGMGVDCGTIGTPRRADNANQAQFMWRKSDAAVRAIGGEVAERTPATASKRNRHRYDRREEFWSDVRSQYSLRARDPRLPPGCTATAVGNANLANNLDCESIEPVEAAFAHQGRYLRLSRT